ncbi:MAG TPA: PQQ-dependent sugar dehydrogenase [Thermoanaerobaculia bacterium]|nr:PQQ-dependent sugar dehydrogenase [Thermoanaerobaculia bacterium]
MLAVVVSAAPIGAAVPAPEHSALVLDHLASGLPPLSGLAHAGDARLFLVALDGRVLVYEGGVVLDQPFLDLRARVRTGGERGLLGVAFHPRHSENGLFFVAYSDLRSDLVIARFAMASDGTAADPASGVALLVIEGYAAGHFAGQLQFGPDGYLYASVGAGPWVGDPQCNAQRLDTLLGKILRLDVDAGASEPPYHTVPPTNPFAAGPAPEVWAYGLRNPWRFSFDRATGDLLVADVGEHQREEINRQLAGSPGGENYGWARMEGTHCVDLVVPCVDPVPPCGDPAFTAPILEHEHVGSFCAVIGGYVYRGAEIPWLEGRYLYGDFCTGRLYAARNGPARWSSEDLGLALPRLSSLGEDAYGEIHLVTTTGVLARLSPWPGSAVPGLCVPEQGRLCLGGRYRVRARWRDAQGRAGTATAVPMTSDAGYLWFFDQGNVELLVKLLDGCAAGFPAAWFFAAALTDVEVDLRVLDTRTGAERRYWHAGGTPFPPIQDTAAFPCP